MQHNVGTIARCATAFGVKEVRAAPKVFNHMHARTRTHGHMHFDNADHRGCVTAFGAKVVGGRVCVAYVCVVCVKLCAWGHAFGVGVPLV